MADAPVDDGGGLGRAHVDLDVLGARVRVVGAAHVCAGLEERWARSLAGPSSTTEPVATIDLPEADLGLSPELELRLVESVTLAGIDHAAGEGLVLLHAAALADEAGQVLGLVAPSGTGKSTAAIALSLDALGYVTDETLAVDANLTVRPWPKPLAIGDHAAGVKQLCGPDELGLAKAPAGPNRLTLRRLVVLDRSPAHRQPRVVQLSTAEALSIVVAQSSSLVRLAHPLRRLETMLSAVGGAWRLEYAEIAAAVPVLRELLGRSEVAPAPAPRFRADAARAVDSLDLDDSVAVLVDDRLLVLAGVGAQVWRTALVPATFEQLHDAVVARLGEHPDSLRLVEQAVAELVDLGLLARDAG